MVEFVDGSIKAQISKPDMRMPIQYSLLYPLRKPNLELSRLDLVDIGDMEKLEDYLLISNSKFRFNTKSTK